MAVIPPLLPGSYTSLRIDSPVEGAELNISLTVYEDVYKAQFFPFEHYNFVGTDEASAHFIVSVKDQPQPGTSPPVHEYITTSKKGYTVSTVTIPTVDDEECILDAIEKVIVPVAGSKDPLYPVLSDNIKDELVKIEDKFPQSINVI